MDIQGQWVWVAGGSSGLGLAVVDALLEAGAFVVVLDKQSNPRVNDIEKRGGKVFIGDICDEALLSEVCAYFDPKRALVAAINTTGIVKAKKLVSNSGVCPLSHFDEILNVNLRGHFLFLREAASVMVANTPLQGEERGVIVQTSSIAAMEGQIGQIAYSASKAAIMGMTLPAARELAQHQIRVMTVAPGIMSTPMLEGMSVAAQQSLREACLFPARPGKAEEYASLVMHILLNPMLNGQTIRLDGGLHLASH